MNLLTSKEREKLLEKLKEQFGISNLPFILLRFGKEKVRGFSGSLSRELLNLDKELRIESCGLYLFNEYEDEIRLSLDSAHILKEQITKNILELNEKQAQDWFCGRDIELEKQEKSKNTFVVLKFKNDFVGCGKKINSIVKNFMPKERRIKS